MWFKLTTIRKKFQRFSFLSLYINRIDLDISLGLLGTTPVSTIAPPLAYRHESIRVVPMAAIGLVLSNVLAVHNSWATPPVDNLFWQQAAPSSGLQYCHGHYVVPPIQSLDQGLPATDQPLYIDADTLQKSSDRTTASGTVIMQQGERVLSSDTLHIDNASNMANASGNVILRNPQSAIFGKKITFNTATGQASVNNGQYIDFASQLRADANHIEADGHDSTLIRNGKFTFCPPGDNSWHISGSNVDVRQNEGVANVTHAVMNIGGVPIFYVPWLSVPIDDRRRSGFLYPRFSTSSTSGLHLATPYYANLAPNYDAIITPQVRTQRGTYISLNGRHLSDLGLSHVKVLWAPKDRLTGTERWYGHYHYSGTLDNGLNASAQFARTSDAELFNDYAFTSSQADKYRLTSRWNLTQKIDTPWLQQVQIGGTHYQELTIGTPAYRAWPYAKASAHGVSTGSSNASYTGTTRWRYNMSYNNFERNNDGLSGLATINGTRVHLTPQISQHWQAEYGFLTTSVSLPTTQYNFRDTEPDQPSQATRNLYQLELDTGLWFDRERDGINAGHQTLEPRLYWTYTPYRNQDNLPVFDSAVVKKPLFQANRFTGADRIGDDHRVTISLASRVTDARGSEKLRMSLSQILFLQDRHVQLPESSVQTSRRSPIYGVLNYTFSPRLSGNLSLDWESNDNIVSAATVGTTYRAHQDYVLHATYSEERDSNRKQVTASAIVPLSTAWTLFSGYKADVQNNRALDQILGVEYADCCWNLRLVGRDWWDDTSSKATQSYYLEMTFNGLGSTDTQLEGDSSGNIAKIMELITGYKQRVK